MRGGERERERERERGGGLSGENNFRCEGVYDIDRWSHTSVLDLSLERKIRGIHSFLKLSPNDPNLIPNSNSHYKN